MSSYQGRVILDLRSTTLYDDEIALLTHRECAGIIIFARNYESPQQLTELTQSINSVDKNLLICVDQEGGRVQRLREGFLKLPPIRELGCLYDDEPGRALIAAKMMGWLMATECIAAGMDFSFAPVLDLDYGHSEVIGNRAFHSSAEAVLLLACEYVVGMQDAGMAAVGKHFPGHGFVAADSHTTLPIDKRSYSEIYQTDLIPFMGLMKAGLDGLMPAHVIYEQCDSHPAGFSEYWIKDILRSQCNYNGVVFSDDLSMAGAKQAGDPQQRARAALEAGCDLLLVCNDQKAAVNVMDSIANLATGSNPKIQQLKCSAMSSADHEQRWKDSVIFCEKAGLLS